MGGEELTARGRSSAVRAGADLIYIKKAREWMDLMDLAIEGGKWNAAGLLGVHAAISAADALTSRYLELRSAGQSHDDVFKLVASVDLSGAPQKAELLSQIVSMKNLVAYEDRDFGAVDAQKLAKQSHRFIAWVEEALRDKGRSA